MDISSALAVLLLNAVVLDGVSADEAILVDTRTATSDLGWTVPQMSNWIEHTTLYGAENQRRVLSVCEIMSHNQNNWLRTQFIEVNQAKRIYVEIEFSIRACEDVPHVKTCKETFNLYYYETDRDDATSTFPPWREGSYIKIDTIAADKRFRPGSNPETNFETRDIGPITKRGVYLAIQDTGACMTIMHVRVYNKFCPSHVQNLATFGRTDAGAEMTSLVAAEGKCVDNAMMQENKSPKLYCNGEGVWTVPSGRCLCGAGFEPNEHLTQCNPCKRKYFKNAVGNQACQRCPSYSSSSNIASTICDCSNRYYRANVDDPTKECTKMPSKPTNLMSYVNNTSVMLRWEKPLDSGGRDDVTYSITCSQCTEEFSGCRPCDFGIDFHPKQSGLTTCFVTVGQLQAHSFYKFKVYSRNGVSEKALLDGEGDNNFIETTVKTSQAAPSPVVGVRVDPTSVSPTSLLIIWDQPRMANGKITKYEVTVQQFRQISDSEINSKENDFLFINPDDLIPTMSNFTINQHLKINHLTPGTSYIIMVRARTSAGFGEYSVPIKAETSGTSPTDDEMNGNSVGDKTLQMVVAVGCGLLVVIIVIAIVLFCLRKKRGKKKLDAEKQPMFSAKEIPGHRTYVDPTTYEDPHRAVRDFTKEIDTLRIKIEQVIGGGEFGDVCRGRMRQPGKPEQDVAVKTLKIGYTTQQKLDFLGEASIMGQFDHPNVIRLEGVVTKTRPLMIVTEFMENGSLDTFLRNHDGQLTVLQLVGMLRHIAEGMRYLSIMGYVHRDLAARNILVDDRLVCKVSDFGLSRVLEDDEEASYTTRGGKIPIRWTAPEAITFRKFTSASDVWSFGIVMWEVMSYGERPYWGMSNQDVIQAVGSGYRLPAPMDCPRVQHQLMLDCWKKDRNQRPKFPQIVSSLDRMLKEPVLLKSLPNNDNTAPKATRNQHKRADSSDANTVTTNTNTGVSSDSATSRSQTDTADDELSYHEETPFVNPTNNTSSNGYGPVTFHRGDDLRMNVISSSTESFVTSAIGSPSSLGSWLDEIGLSQFKDNFMKNGCASLEQILQLTASDLTRMGISTPTHQDRIIDSISNMRETTHHNNQRASRNYYQHRMKSYESEAPPKYEETCRNSGIPNGVPV